MTTEAKLWATQSATATAAFDFWNDFLNLQEGAGNNTALSATYRNHWICLIRAVSWVESKHGTAGANQPARDPMQCGNPADSWWRSVTNRLGDSDRIVGGPSRGNWWGHELPAAAAANANFPANAELTHLTTQNDGHGDANFNASMSYYWGVVYLIHRVNNHGTDSSNRTYKCDAYSDTRLENGAVDYNGGGDSNYATKLAAALGGEIGCSLP